MSVSPFPSMKYYYASANNQPTGPVSLADLQKLASEGKINASTAIIPEGASAWTTWAELSNTASPSPTSPAANAAPDASAVMAEKVVQTVKSMPIGDMLIGTLLVFLSFFTTPFAVLSRSFSNLAEWGSARRLPTSDSELPVLTYFTIVGRPLAHVAWLVVWFLIGIVSLFSGGMSLTSSREIFPSYNFGKAIAGMAICWLIAYFGQLVVGWIVESVSVVVRLANDVNKIAKR